MKRPYGFFLMAGFAAMLAALIVYHALKNREAEVERAKVQSINVVVASRDISLGSKIDATSVKLTRWSRDSVPAGGFTELGAVIGSTAKDSFVANEPITGSKLFLGEKTAGVMPLLIPPGMRAMSVQVDEVSDIAGFVLPHSHVDVLVALGSGESSPTGKPFSKLVLQNVEVLAVAQTIERKKDDPQVVKTVTLLVTPEDAERLTLAGREGILRLAMRSFNDNKIVMTHGADVRDIVSANSLGLPDMTAGIQHQPAVSPVHHAVDTAEADSVRIDVLRNGRSEESLSFIDESTTHSRHSERGIRHDSKTSEAPVTTGHSDDANAASASSKPAATPAAPAPAASDSKAQAALAAESSAAMPNRKVIDIP